MNVSFLCPFLQHYLETPGREKLELQTDCYFLQQQLTCSKQLKCFYSGGLVR